MIGPLVPLAWRYLRHAANARLTNRSYRPASPLDQESIRIRHGPVSLRPWTSGPTALELDSVDIDLSAQEVQRAAMHLRRHSMTSSELSKPPRTYRGLRVDRHWRLGPYFRIAAFLSMRASLGVPFSPGHQETVKARRTEEGKASVGRGGWIWRLQDLQQEASECLVLKGLDVFETEQ
jgi:hypothetical protein